MSVESWGFIFILEFKMSNFEKKIQVVLNPLYPKTPLSFTMAGTILAVITTTSLISSTKLPEINIDGWRPSDNIRNWNITSNAKDILSPGSTETVFIVPSGIGGLSLLCNSTYPIEWSFHRERWGRQTSWTIMITNMRGSESSNLNPLWYSSELRFAGGNTEITGNYTCQQWNQPEMSSSVYIYWEGNSPPYLTLLQRHKESRKVKFNPDESRDKSFTLPCTVSKPDIVVDLYKKYNENVTKQLAQNRSIKFNPAVGFTLIDLPDPIGSYQCIVGDKEDSDLIEFEVLKGNRETQEFENIIMKNASFKYDPKKLRFECCSSTFKPPKMSYQLCNHPTLCKLRKHLLHDMEYTGRSRRVVNGSCSYLNLPMLRGKLAMAGGVLRCLGDSVDFVREYFFPVTKSFQEISTNSSLSPFYSWSQADSDKMMSLTDFKKPFYIGELKKITCEVSPYYYSQGIHWGIQYRQYQNDTSVLIKANQTRIGRRHAFSILEDGNEASIKVFAEDGLHSLTCHAPIWNSSEWHHKTLYFDIQKPILPKIQGSLVEELNWYVNETNKVLECQFSGTPIPNIYWKKDNKHLIIMRWGDPFSPKNYFLRANHTNVSTSLKFPTVGLNTKGTYSCNLTNVGGTVEKIFKVNVSAGVSAEIIFLYVFSVLCVIGVAIGGYFGWDKMKEQKETMRRLANVAFKDVADSQPNQYPTIPIVNHQDPAILPTHGSVNNGFFGDSQSRGFFHEPNHEQTNPTNDFGKYQKM